MNKIAENIYMIIFIPYERNSEFYFSKYSVVLFFSFNTDIIIIFFLSFCNKSHIMNGLKIFWLQKKNQFEHMKDIFLSLQGPI